MRCETRVLVIIGRVETLGQIEQENLVAMRLTNMLEVIKLNVWTYQEPETAATEKYILYTPI